MQRKLKVNQMKRRLKKVKIMMIQKMTRKRMTMWNRTMKGIQMWMKIPTMKKAMMTARTTLDISPTP